MKATFEAMADFLEEKMTDAQLEKGIVIGFDLSEHYAKDAHVHICKNLTGEGLRLELALEFPDSDSKMSHYLLKGTRRDFIDYLRSPGGQAELLRSIDSLDESIRLHD